MSLKPAAEPNPQAQLCGECGAQWATDSLIDMTCQVSERRGYQAGREAGFSKGIEMAARRINVASCVVGDEAAQELAYVETEVRKLVCPAPEAESEGRDGDG